MLKKVMALMLAFVIVLSLCACGAEKPNDQKPETEGSLSFTEMPPIATNPTSPTEGIETEENKLPVIGEIKLQSMRERDDRPATIALHENNTCEVGDKSYRWETKADSQYVLNYYVAILEGDTERYRLSFASEPGIAWLTAGEDEFIYLDLSVYEKVELTVENWDTYFEMKEDFQISKNAFDEFTSAEQTFFYYLRESFFERLYNKEGNPLYNQDQVAAEVQIAEQRAKITVNVQDETRTVEPYGSTVQRESVCNSYQEREYFRIHIDSPHFGEKEWECDYPVAFALLRVKGHLWLKKA